MPRSYSYEHFKVVPPGQAERIRDHEKKAVAEQEAHDDEVATPEPKIHYGKRHAQTEEILHARQMEKQLEELAGVDRMPPKRAEARVRPQQKARAEIREPQVSRGMPIGALPEQREPPEPGLLRELYDEAGRHARVVRLSVRDIGRASWRLVTLPLQAARLAALRLRHRHA